MDSRAVWIFSRDGFGPARRRPSTSTLAAAKPSSMAGLTSVIPLALARSKASLTSGKVRLRSFG
ncbi:hypothetical protein D3C81_2259920 [compost metagenome]